MYQNMYNTPAQQGSFNPYEQNVRILKEFFSKPLFLIIALCGIISAVLTLVSSFMTDSSSNIDIILDEYRFYFSNSEYRNIVSTVQSISIGIAIILTVYSLLIALGYLLLHFKSKNSDASSNPKAGATILWVTSIIELIIACILAVLIIFFSIAMFAASSYSSNSYYSSSYYDVASPVMITLGILGLIVSVCLILSCIFKLLFFSSVHSGFTKVNLTSRGSVGFGVFTILGTIFSVISFFQLLSNLGDTSILSFIVSLLNLVSSICIIIFAFSFNSYIKKFRTGTNPVNGFTNQPPRGGQPFMPPMQGNNPPFTGNGYNTNPQNKPPQAPDMNMGYTYRPSQNQPNQDFQPVKTPDQQPKPMFNNNDPFKQPQNNQNSQSFQNTQNDKNVKSDSVSKCPLCGAPHGNNDVFCGGCGARLK